MVSEIVHEKKFSVSDSDDNAQQKLTSFTKESCSSDRNQWRAVCGSKTPSTTKEALASSRQDI
jgi:hypothetical protein